jgi:hypothetical protein
MVKSLAAIAILAVIGTSVIALPGLAPKVEASQTYALAKGDRLQVRSPVIDCSKQTSPEFASSCLRNSDPAARILTARLVVARR